MKILTSLSLVVAIAIISGCEAKKYELMVPSVPAEAKSFSSAKYEYRIQPHDRLSITTYQYPELLPTSMNEKGILVDSNGYISLPLVHRVHVAGLTQPEASKKLERLYKKYLKEPSFNVEAMNKRVFVLGEVKKPGVVNLDKEQTNLLEVLAASGDLTDNAVRDDIIILSKDSLGKMHMRKVDLTNFDAMNNTDMMIRSGDIVYVRPNKWKKYKVQTDNISTIVSEVSKLALPYVVLKYDIAPVDITTIK